ncbi:hypothetical protein H2200_007235 [Cladophialophora chaetospira]|uniref:Uncharacterized protein n=1 Tax=Cladophialophora chaetospira TaxID=386627 RepID=A0AA39CHC1_9EURO|nr:hypothetical protein H2200_007235 [Cladophialophora chaetospira]
MQLRKSITIPARLEDEEPVTPNNRNGTKPAHAGLMKATLIPFNPDNPPAAFPSLPLMSKAAPAADIAEADDVATGDSETLSSLPKQTSLVGVSSEDEEEEPSHDETSQIDPTDEQDSVEQDETPESATEREVLSLTSILTAKSPTSATQTGNNDGNALEQDASQQHGDTANVGARATVSLNQATTTPTTVNPIAPTTSQGAGQDETITDGSARAGTSQTQAIASSTAIAPPFVASVNWRDLPLSMQYRIFQTMYACDPSGNHVVRILGLTELETAQIWQAVRVRAMHPASLDDIRRYCLSISTPIPGVQPLVTSPTGGIEQQWSIDRDIYAGYLNYMVFVCNYDCASRPQVRLAEAFLAERRLPRGIIGTWAPDPAAVPGSGDLILVPDREAAQTSQTIARVDAARGSAVPSRAGTGPRLPLASSSSSAQELYFPGSNVCIVESSSARRADRDREFHPALSRQIPRNGPPRPARVAQLTRSTQPARRHPLATVSTPDDPPTPPRTGQGARQDGSSLGSATTHRPITRSTGNIPTQAAPASTLEAGNMPMQLTSSEPLDSDDARNALKDTTTTSSTQTASNTDEKARPEDLPLTSNPSSGSHRLVLKIYRQDGLAQLFRKAPSTTPDLSNQTEATTSVAASSGIDNAAENVPLKRKASRSDIRPDASKTPRLPEGSAPTTPPRGVVPYDVDNIERLHSEAKRAAAADDSMDVPDEPSTPTHSINVVPTGKASEDPVTTSAQAGATEAGFPPSPTFSTITEFEDLPEYQALLEPVKHRLRVKTPASSIVSADCPSKKKPQTLRLIVSERSYPAKKMTRARKAQEQRELEEALVARAAGIKKK